MAKAQKTSFRSPFYPTDVANEAFDGSSGLQNYQHDSSNSQRNNDNRISICCPKNNARGSIILAVAGVAVVIRVALNLQVKWGYLKEHDSTLGLFALALIAGFTLLMVPGILVRWERTREIGFIIYHRVGDISAVKKNWEDETLRSFIELCIWFGVCWGTWGHSKSVFQSVFCASFAGCFVALVGDYTAPYVKNLELLLRRAGSEAAGEHLDCAEMKNTKVSNNIVDHTSRNSKNSKCGQTQSELSKSDVSTNEQQSFIERESAAIFDSRKSGTLVTLTIYGYNLFSMTYSFCNDLLLAAVICASAATLLLSVARVLLQYERTKRLGIVIQDRILCTFENWSSHPMRSTLESMIWTGVTIGAYTAYGSLLMAVQAGTLSGVLICVFGELNTLGTADGASEEPREVRLVPLCIFGYFGLASSYFILHNSHSMYTASLMTAIAGAGYLLAARLIMYWSPTRRAGELIQGRFTMMVANWEEYTFRSALEAGVWVTSWWVTFIVTRSFWIATPVGTFVSIAMVIMSDCLGYGANAGAGGEKTAMESPVGCQDEKAKLKNGHDDKNSKLSSGSNAFAKETKQNEEAVTSRHTTNLCNQRTQQAGCLPEVESRFFTLDEVAKHCKESDAWIIIHGCVYDVTSWLKRHPGGKEIILKYAGYDASDQFEAFHCPKIRKYLNLYLIGSLGESIITTKIGASADYRKLRERLWKEGYFQSNQTYFLQRHLLWLVLITVGVTLLLQSSHNKYMIAASAFCVGMGLVQAAFLSHDALHNSIISILERKSKVNWYGWFVGSVVFGISSDMWLVEHNLHHAITVRPREDPQYNMLPFFLVSKKELSGPYRFNPTSNRLLAYLLRIFVPVQHWTLVPFALLLGRVNLCRLSVLHTFNNCLSKPQAAADVIGMLLHLSLFSLLLFYGIDNYQDRILFFLCICMTVGILHVQLLVSHIATDTFLEKEEREMGYFEFQLRTTRNIDCQGRSWEHVLHGGLEYQIEHHLFPQLPRHNLHLVKPYVMSICTQHNIKYESVTFTKALGACWTRMQDLANDIILPHEICTATSEESIRVPIGRT